MRGAGPLQGLRSGRDGACLTFLGAMARSCEAAVAAALARVTVSEISMGSRAVPQINMPGRLVCT